MGHSWTGGAAETQDRARKVGLALQIQEAEPKAAATAGRHSRTAEKRESVCRALLGPREKEAGWRSEVTSNQVRQLTRNSKSILPLETTGSFRRE